MKVHQLKALVALAEHGSMRAAAVVLHVSQPAVTQAIKELEEQVETQLVARTAGGVVLTEAGQLLLQHARRVVHEIDAARTMLAERLGKLDAQLSIGVTPMAAPLLQQAIPRFRKLRPATRLGFYELRHAQMLEQVREGTLDFGVATFPADIHAPELLHTPLFTFRNTLAVRRGHALAKRCTLDALAAAEWLYNGTADDFDRTIGGAFRAQGLTAPTAVTLCTSMALYWSLAATTDAVSVWTSEIVLATPAARNAVVPVPVEMALPEVALGLVTRRHYVLSPAAATFQWAVEEAARSGPPSYGSYVWAGPESNAAPAASSS